LEKEETFTRKHLQDQQLSIIAQDLGKMLKHLERKKEEKNVVTNIFAVFASTGKSIVYLSVSTRFA